MIRALIIVFVFLIFSCEPRQGQQAQELPPKTTSSSLSNKMVATEVIQAKSYTYVKGENNGNEIWIAILKREVEVGNTYYYGKSMEMKDFHSKDLDRTFKSILFLEGISDSPDGINVARNNNPHDAGENKKSGAPRQEMTIQHNDDETKIGYLYENKASLVNKKIKVKGVVTKFNQGIMNTNWVHIQDGTGGVTTFDLTITTDDVIKVGTIASFEGVVAVDKDFGHGYKYALMLEDATLLNKNSDIKVN